MGADRKRHHAGQSGGNRNRTAGNAKLAEVHRYSHSWQLPDARNFGRGQRLSGFRGFRSLCVQISSICGAATNKALTRRLFTSNLFDCLTDG
jgi:hypothetical protein